MERGDTTGYLTVSETADVLGLSREWVHKLVAQGKMDSVTARANGKGPSKRIMIPGTAIDEYIREKVSGSQRGPALSRLKGALNRTSAVTPERVDEMVAEYENAQPINRIARRHRLAPETVKELLAERGVTLVDRDGRKLRTMETLLKGITDEQMDRIVHLYTREGHGMQSIATAMSLGKSGPYKVRRVLQKRGVAIRSKAESAVHAWRHRKDDAGVAV